MWIICTYPQHSTPRKIRRIRPFSPFTCTHTYLGSRHNSNKQWCNTSLSFIQKKLLFCQKNPAQAILEKIQKTEQHIFNFFSEFLYLVIIMLTYFSHISFHGWRYSINCLIQTFLLAWSFWAILPCFNNWRKREFNRVFILLIQCNILPFLFSVCFVASEHKPVSV